MDAAEFFRTVVKPNYDQFVQNPTDLRLLWNAIVSMNTVAEFLALHRLGYPPLYRENLNAEAKKLRDLSALTNLKHLAETLKHVRKTSYRPRQVIGTTSKPPSITATSTSFEPDNPSTWEIDGHDPVKVVHDAFAMIKAFPELQ